MVKERARATKPMKAGWRFVAERSETKDGVKQEQAWSLWHRWETDQSGWHNFVLRHNDRRFRKFSYWGAWNEKRQRLARVRDLAVLRANHPQVYKWLEAVCRNKWSV
jgi:hypothetical protein